MFRRTLGITTLALAAAAAPTRADIMHWFWEVEVNGTGVAVDEPIRIEAGDGVEVSLWADFTPFRDGFAGAGFAISTGESFFANGAVNYGVQDGYGLNPYLLTFGVNGNAEDENGDGVPERIDEIVGFQLHPDWGVTFDDSDPIFVYSIGWTVHSDLADLVVLEMVPMLSGDLGAEVWVDAYTTLAYPITSDRLVFIPCPPAFAMAAMGLCSSLRPRRHSCPLTTVEVQHVQSA